MRPEPRPLAGLEPTPVAIDHPTQAEAKPETRASAIENELPTYRAIHPMAVISLIAGIASVLGFADLWFLVAAAVALVAGAVALWKIQKLPDLFTGRSFALAGIVLALVFGTFSTTWTVADYLKLQGEIRQFSQKCIDTINTRNVPDILWWRMDPERRRGLTPAQAVERMKEAMPDEGNQQRMVGEVGVLTKQLAKYDGKVEFLRLEEYGSRDLAPFAVVVLKVDLPGYQSKDEGEKYAILLVNKDPKATSNPWWIQYIGYPYQPKSFVVPSKPLDDGHNHGDGEHGH
jgi:hypothetical protein